MITSLEPLYKASQIKAVPGNPYFLFFFIVFTVNEPYVPVATSAWRDNTYVKY